jgi:hypothetical protein
MWLIAHLAWLRICVHAKMKCMNALLAAMIRFIYINFEEFSLMSF